MHQRSTENSLLGAVWDCQRRRLRGRDGYSRKMGRSCSQSAGQYLGERLSRLLRLICLVQRTRMVEGEFPQPGSSLVWHAKELQLYLSSLFRKVCVMRYVWEVALVKQNKTENYHTHPRSHSSYYCIYSFIYPAKRTILNFDFAQYWDKELFLSNIYMLNTATWDTFWERVLHVISQWRVFRITG